MLGEGAFEGEVVLGWSSGSHGTVPAYQLGLQVHFLEGRGLEAGL